MLRRRARRAPNGTARINKYSKLPPFWSCMVVHLGRPPLHGTHLHNTQTHTDRADREECGGARGAPPRDVNVPSNTYAREKSYF